MPNPYAPGNPADPVREFAGRAPEIRRIRECVASSVNGQITHVFIEGEWGIGKTSLLQKLRPILEEHGPVISEDVAEGDSEQTASFYSAVFQELMERRPRGIQPEDVAPPEPFGTWDARTLRRVLKRIWDGLSGKHKAVFIALDNLERANPAFVSGIRDVFQRLAQEGARYMLLFAGKSLPTQGSAGSDPVGRFFNPKIVVRAFTDEESIEAVQKPVKYLPGFSFSDDAARLIHERAAGHPYFLKLICHEIYDLSGGRGEVDPKVLERHWPSLEERLEDQRFGGQWKGLSDGEQATLLRASLLQPTFAPKELRSVPSLSKSLDTHLRRLVEDELLRTPQRGAYEFYHPLFRTYVQAKAREKKLVQPTSRSIPERRPALGRQEMEECLAAAGSKYVRIVDQHFRGRAPAMLEAVGDKALVQILMGEDPAWPKTQQRLEELEIALRRRVEVRAWPDKSQGKPIPWHYRSIHGDKRGWRFDHSLDGAGKKKAWLTEMEDRSELDRDFKRWWKESRRVFPQLESDAE